MEFKANVKYDGTVAEVVKVLMSRALADARAQALGIADYSFESSENTAVTRFTVEPEGMPAKVKNFMRTGLTAAITAALDPVAHRISHKVKLQGVPAAITFAIDLTEDAGKTRADFTGEVKVSIPLLGKELEKQAVAEVAELLAEDAKLVNQQL
ncbi:MAG: DUF2505 domain-containing protein [Trueperella sp.]|nr:DUF2505 domain-containing protein [Trueperella sp.]